LQVPGFERFYAIPVEGSGFDFLPEPYGLIKEAFNLLKYVRLVAEPL